MYPDFHYYGTYFVARQACHVNQEASIIAYAAQQQMWKTVQNGCIKKNLKIKLSYLRDTIIGSEYMEL